VRHRSATLVACASLGLCCTATAQPQLEARRLIEIDVNNPPPNLAADQVPVPFPIPRTGVEYRPVADLLTTILPQRGTDVAVLSPTSLNDSLAGTQRPGGPPPRPARPIFHVAVQATVELPDGTRLPRSQRPDGTFRGRAVIVAGVHPREWVAVEAVTRQLERFHPPPSATFENDLLSLREGKAPGTREVFFAENLRIAFVPLLNPGAYETTQATPDRLHMLRNDTAAGVTGQLRGGRLRRKNLRDTDGVHESPAANDPDALLGVDLNRNMTTPSTGSPDDRHVTFQGDPLSPEPETQDLRDLLDTVFRAGGVRMSGAAFLDVHTFADTVILPGSLPSEQPLPGGEVLTDDVIDYGNAVAQAAFGRDSESLQQFAAGGPVDRGAADELALNEFGVASATFELPADSAVRAMVQRFLLPGGNLWEVGGRSFERTTEGSLQFLVGPGAAFNDQLMTARAGVDAALTYATGPPYVREVLIVQDQDGDGAYQLDDERELIYRAVWEKDGPATRRLVERSSSTAWLNGNEEARIAVVFSKPMQTATGELDRLTFQARTDSVDVRTTNVGLGISDPARSGWRSAQLREEDEAQEELRPLELGARRYADDTWVGTFELSVAKAQGVTIRRENAVLQILAADEVGLRVDSDPASAVEWDVGQRRFDGYQGVGLDANHDGFQIDTVVPGLRKAP